MYLPFRDEDSWWVIDAADGAVKAKIPIGRGKNYAVDPIATTGPHNTWINTAGTRVYMEVLTLPWIFIVDTATNKVVRTIKVGIESSNRDSLEEMHRRQPKDERIRRLLAACDRRGIGVVGFYLIGLPDDTEASIEASIDYARDLNTLGAQFTIVTPYPGTGYFEEVKREGRLLTEDWEKFDIYTPVIRHDRLSPEDLLRLKARAFQRYYLRPRWAGKAAVHSWRRLRVHPSQAPAAERGGLQVAGQPPGQMTDAAHHPA